ncbi:MAG: tetratricopeptide repeat protein [Pyrinomonadaceae bacterium]|nr:tetratricopeptide repeat protein [Pyrinomonadaceae bacterium]
MYLNKQRLKTWTGVLITVITLVISAQAQNGVAGGLPAASVSVMDSTKDQDGLVGSVRRVKVQSAKLELKSGQLLEGALQLLEITTYGLNGNRIDNASFPVNQSSSGKEEYKYNDRGNIIQMTLRGNDGSILSREDYEYEFDTFGNWTKMVTSLVVFENGELKHEPVEVTYREISYYFDDSVARIVKRVSPQIILPAPSPRFPELGNVPSPQMQPDKLMISVRPLSFEVSGDPPELPKPAKEEKRTLTRSKAEPGRAPDSNAGAAPIPSTSTNAISVEGTGTVLARKETVSGPPADRKSAVAYYNKGREYFDLGAFKEAVDFYRRSLELEPRSAETYLSLGHAYLKLKNNSEALKAFKQATLINPEFAEAHYGIGLHYFGVGQYKNAADAFKRATLLRPNMAKAHYGLALAYQVLGKTGDVVAELRILETLDRSLARKLSDSFPKFDRPCRTVFCK